MSMLRFDKIDKFGKLPEEKALVEIIEGFSLIQFCQQQGSILLLTGSLVDRNSAEQKIHSFS